MKTELGRRLKADRDAVQLTQEGLARKARLAGGFIISRVEAGQRGFSMRTARRVARVLNQDADEYVALALRQRLTRDERESMDRVVDRARKRGSKCLSVSP